MPREKAQGTPRGNSGGECGAATPASDSVEPRVKPAKLGPELAGEFNEVVADALPLDARTPLR